MAVARVSGSAASGLLVALLVCSTVIVAVVGGTCDGVSCGMGTCKEVLALYECECEPGWSQLFKIFPFMPCTNPTCPSSHSCFNLTLTVPKGIPLTDPCVAVDCGSEGTCVKEQGLRFHCECNPGAVNAFGVPVFPCIQKNCVIGQDDCVVPPPPPPPSPSPPPPGSVSLQTLLLLLLASLAAVRIV